MHGDVRGIAERSYYQGGRSTPRPIRLVCHAGHGTWDETVRSALALAKMDWNNDALFDMLPVTMAYAKVTAGTTSCVNETATATSVPPGDRFLLHREHRPCRIERLVGCRPDVTAARPLLNFYGLSRLDVEIAPTPNAKETCVSRIRRSWSSSRAHWIRNRRSSGKTSAFHPA
jgi:hypothetical protein